MDQVYWYLAGAERTGPFEQNEIAGLIQAGTITRETLIWDSGVNEWIAAGTAAAFFHLFEGAVPPPPPGSVHKPVVPGALQPDFPVWGLFWRGFVRAFASLFVIPAPWAAAFYYRFVASRIALPNGVRLRFEGRAGDIWYIFIAIAILNLFSRSQKLSFLAVLVSIPLGFYVWRWGIAKAAAEDGSLTIKFTGRLLPYIGWQILLFASIFTIIGWAWVLKFYYNWLSRNVEGTHHFDFTATGGAILWHLGVFIVQIVLFGALIFAAAYLSTIGHGGVLAGILGLASIPVFIAIPWTLRWIANWFVSAISVKA